MDVRGGWVYEGKARQGKASVAVSASRATLRANE